MATTEHQTTAESTVLTLAYQQGQVELAWHAAIIQLRSGKFSIDLPHDITSAIGEDGLNEILNRYSNHIRATGSMIHDAVNDVWRFLPPPYFQGNGASSASSVQSPVAQPPQVTHSPVSMPSMQSGPPVMPPPRPRRPMNAFMLYRKDNHPIVAANNPGVHNNQISQIIGLMWRHESEDVKNEYKRKSRLEVLALMQAHPDYRYSPRKSSDIKRRKTKVKDNGKGKVSGKFQVSDSPLNFVEPSALEKDARAVDSLAGGQSHPHQRNALTQDNVMALFASAPHGWINMGMPSRADQQAYSGALDNNELTSQAEANASATATLAREIATTQPALFDISHPFSGNFEAISSADYYDPFAVAAQRNMDLAAEGILEPLGNFTFPDREANFDLNELNSNHPF